MKFTHLNASVGQPVSGPGAGPRSARATAFSLIEMLVVIVIIGVLAGLAAPSIIGLRDSDTMTAGCRQLVDDIGIARQRALNERTRVFVVFLPEVDLVTNSATGIQLYNPITDVVDNNLLLTNTVANDLLPAQCRSYALFSLRALGDQPGRNDPKYLTSWQTLPDRTYIPKKYFFTNQFRLGDRDFPFPDETSPHRYYLPYIEISPLAQLNTTNNQDVFIQIAQGSVSVGPRENGLYRAQVVDILERPVGNSVDNPHYVVINWLTARGKVQRLELQ